MNRKKELKESYKLMKTEMGVFIIRSKKNNKCYIDSNKNLKGYINRITFQLKYGSFSNRELQKDWTEQGEEAFDFTILEKLEYEKDDTKEDYSEDLAILQMIWEEKLAKQELNFYNK